MASPTVQMNVRVSPELADAVKERADREQITMSAAVIAALQAYTKSNGAGDPSPDEPARAATKKGR